MGAFTGMHTTLVVQLWVGVVVTSAAAVPARAMDAPRVTATAVKTRAVRDMGGPSGAGVVRIAATIRAMPMAKSRVAVTRATQLTPTRCLPDDTFDHVEAARVDRSRGHGLSGLWGLNQLAVTEGHGHMPDG